MDDNKNIILVGVGLIFCVFFLTWLLFGGKSEKRPQYAGAKKNVESKSGKKSDGRVETYSGSPSKASSYDFSSGSSSNDSPGKASPFSEEEKQAMALRKKEAETLISESAQNWLTTRVNDENLPEKVKEKYRLKTIASYVEGTNLKKRKNYPEALKAFMNALKDPNASPVSKYYTLLNMKTIALKMKDLDLFIAISKSEAELIYEEDLKTIGISKSKEPLEWIENFEKMMKAKRDPSVMADLVQKRMDYTSGKFPREEIEADVKNEIERYESIFKELMS